MRSIILLISRNKIKARYSQSPRDNVQSAIYISILQHTAGFVLAAHLKYIK